MDGTVLIADDDRTIRTVLTQALTRAGCRVHATGTLSQLMRWVEEGRGDLVVTDVMMPDGNGIDMIPQIRRTRADLPVIVISAQNTIVTTIRATEADAFDYLPKPFDLPDLMARVRAGLSRRPRRATGANPGDGGAEGAETPATDPAAALVGRAPAMQALFRTLARVVNADLPVIVAGESGSGRTTVARALHEFGDRKGAALVRLTPADALDALGDAMVRATGGTLLIEDAGSLDPTVQGRLVGLIESAESGPDRARAPRLVATTGPDPMAEMAAGRLRQDLYYRLAGLVLTVPPLRARLDDIPPLARHLLARAAGQGLPGRTLGQDAAEVLRAHPFPGNVRELENLLRRLAVTGSAPDIGADEVRAALGGAAGYAAGPAAPPVARTAGPATPEASALPQAAAMAGPTGRLAESVEQHLQRYFDLHGDQLPPAGLYDRILREIERPLIQIALDASGGNQLRCAELLGINRNTLRKKVNDLNIEVTRRRRLM
ncbi:sigma-54-dependent transcriptional regulator [Paracoccus endophyticus]|uniref:response regulator n=1 Tax=Paracoccus endophyticus TaxID=2233774 RepID=UPI000DD9B8DE|nr:sigma-54 dependent transcriptional regulator [Paracoccus endophyticus]